MPRHDPNLILLTAIQTELVDGPSLADARPSVFASGPEGAYARVTALPPDHLGLLSPNLANGSSVAIVLPLDALFDDRVLAARRVWRALVRRAKVKPTGITAHRRRRLKLVLRALDGHLAGESYRGIANGLFPDRVPEDIAWRSHPLRSFTIRLVRDGLALMRGGYLRLLRPDHRDR